MSYGIYIAKVVGVSTETDDRLQVRVLPQMDDNSIPDNKCPLWPYFFKNETFTGKNNELVWVICDEEFSSGYILGIANYNTVVENDYVSGKVYSNDSKNTNFSIPKDLKKSFSNYVLSLTGTSLDYNNVRVTYWSDSCIHLLERSTGGTIIAFSIGTVFVLRPNCCLFSIGGNTLMIDDKGISMKGDKINLQSANVNLGDNPTGSVAVTLSSTDTAIVASKYVKA